MASGAFSLKIHTLSINHFIKEAEVIKEGPGGPRPNEALTCLVYMGFFIVAYNYRMYDYRNSGIRKS